MSIFTRYLIGEITKVFFIILAVVIAIYLAVDFFEKIDSFLDSGVPAVRAFCFFLFKIPLIITQMLPVSLLLSVLVTFGIMNKQNEIVALKSSGISIYHLFKSVALVGVAGALSLFFLTEMVVPAAMSNANRIWREDVKGGGTLKTRKNIWINHDRTLFKIGEYNPDSQVMYDVTVYFLDKEFHFTKRLDADRGEFEEDGWVMEKLFEQTFDPATGVPNVAFHDRLKVSMPLTPDNEDLLQATTDTDEMSCQALRTKIETFEAAGDDALRYRVDLQDKMARPAVCLIMCLMGTGIAVRRKRREGLPVIISYGIAIAFLYYIALSLCVSFGYGGILPPVVAAWAAHGIFLCVGGVMLVNAE